MRAWQLNGVHDLNKHQSPLELADIPIPIPEKDEVLIKVICCGVCHTELDEIEGRTPPPHYPMTLGHQVVGNVEQLGVNAKQLQIGARVGVAWVFSTCGECEFCLKGFENRSEEHTSELQS